VLLRASLWVAIQTSYWERSVCPRISSTAFPPPVKIQIGHDIMTIVIMLLRCPVKRMAAGNFKAQCLAVMDQVLETGEPVLITKHGKPVAQLIPAQSKADDIFGYMAGKVRVVGDIVGSVTPLEDWENK
jgi:prevent-host-death family protein